MNYRNRRRAAAMRRLMMDVFGIDSPFTRKRFDKACLVVASMGCVVALRLLPSVVFWISFAALFIGTGWAVAGRFFKKGSFVCRNCRHLKEPKDVGCIYGPNDVWCKSCMRRKNLLIGSVNRINSQLDSVLDSIKRLFRKK